MEDKRIIKKENIIKSIIKTKYSECLLYFDNNDNEKLVLKKVLKKEFKSCILILNELEILKNSKHDNIVEFDSFIEEEEHCLLITKYCSNGVFLIIIKTLENYIDFNKHNNIEYIIYGIAKALDYLHNKLNIIHRDIKPSNVFFDDNMTIKLGDFNLSIKIKELKHFVKAGSIHYMAPEIKNGKSYSYKVDVWSLGIILYRMLFSDHPFKSLNDKYNNNNYELKFPRLIDLEIENLLIGMLKEKQDERYDIKTVLKSPIFKDIKIENFDEYKIYIKNKLN